MSATLSKGEKNIKARDLLLTVYDKAEITQELMDTLLNMLLKNTDEVPLCVEVEGVNSVTSSPSGSEDNSSVGTGSGCPYEFSKGKNKGQTCGKKTKGGVVYCSRHKKFEDTIAPKTKKSLPNPKKSESKTTKKEPEKKVSKVLRKNHAINRLWHEHSRLVFKSAKERVVIGICQDGDVLPLSEADIETCKFYSFAFEKEEVTEEEGVTEKEGVTEEEEVTENKKKESLFDNNVAFSLAEEDTVDTSTFGKESVRKITSTDDVGDMLNELQLEDGFIEEEE